MTLITFQNRLDVFFPSSSIRGGSALCTIEPSMSLFYSEIFVPLVSEKKYSVYVVLIIITLIVSRAEYYMVFLSNLSFDELLIHVFFPNPLTEVFVFSY